MSDIAGLPPIEEQPPITDLVAFVRDPQHHRLIMAVIRRESLRDPDWFSAALRKEERIQGHPFTTTTTRETAMPQQDDNTKPAAPAAREALLTAIAECAAGTPSMLPGDRAAHVRNLSEAFALVTGVGPVF